MGERTQGGVADPEGICQAQGSQPVHHGLADTDVRGLPLIEGETFESVKVPSRQHVPPLAVAGVRLPGDKGAKCTLFANGQ